MRHARGAALATDVMSSNERLDSWKEIAAYLKRGVRTVQRWEHVAGLPVRRIATARGAVYAFRGEIDAWWRTQSIALATSTPAPPLPPASDPPVPRVQTPDASPAAATTASMRVRPFVSHTLGIDPDSAPTQANLAVYFFTLVAMGMLRPTEGMPAARAAAQRALDLDPANTDAHVVSALVASLYEHDWAGATQQLEVVLRRDRVSPSARFHYATWHLSPLGRHAEAQHQLTLALADDPLYLLGRVQYALELQSLGRSDEGLAELEAVWKIDPRFGPALGLAGREYALRGRVADALSFAERTYAAAPRHANAVGFLAGMLRRTGSQARADEVLATLDGDSAWVRARARAEAHVVCMEFDGAIEALSEASAARDPGVWLVIAGTTGNIIRSMSGWPALCARLGMDGFAHRTVE